ncbi:MAG TPA: sigma 54-interacting transcriptional regulator, partial [Planctomycetota bacterium]|nr:sigma 54-interacting transcriptional regulator [Planctomycetota bacterium]
AAGHARRALALAEANRLGSERLEALDLLARAGGTDLAALEVESLERGPWLADLLFTRAAAHEAAGRKEAADADNALALSILGETPSGPVEARGLLQRVEADLSRVQGLLSRGAPDYGKLGELLSRAARDLSRSRALVEAHDCQPLRPALARATARLAAVGEGAEGGDMSGLAALAERLRNLERLAEINKVLNAEHEPQRLLDLIVDSAIEITGAARGFLILFDGRAEEFRAARHIDESSIRHPEFEISHSVARRVVKEGRPILTANAIDDPRLGGAASISELKLLSILCVPLVSRDRTLGAIYLDHPQVVGRFDERQLETVTALAEQAAIALENARLSEGLARSNDELRGSREEIARLNVALEARLVQREAELETVRESLDASRRALALRYDYGNIVTRSPRMHEVLDLMDRITDTEFPVLIFGDSGTGKELIARAIHFNGRRKEQNFVSLNCAAFAEPLIESELFGHVRGAFTGADRDRKGLFDQAHGGTLFLDEIGDMSLEVQKRLLRVLQEGEFIPVGGREVRKVDVRILCATHRDLRKLVAEGRFREDLYYRLAVAQIRLPPLRERGEDIALLLPHFLERHGGQARAVDPEALALLRGQGWPGNVRELENFAMNLLLFDREGTRVTAEQVRRLLAAGTGEAPALPDAAPAGGALRERVDAYERRLIEEALARAGGSKSAAARDLGVGIRTLYKMLERLGIG